MRRRSTAGVTLMELLISVVLLSLLSVGLLFALRIGLNAYSKTQTRLMDNRRVAGAQRILEEELEGLMPVVAPCGIATEGGGTRPILPGAAGDHAAGLHLFPGRRVARSAADPGNLRHPGRRRPGRPPGGQRDSLQGPPAAGRFCLGRHKFFAVSAGRNPSCWPTSWRSAGFRTWTSRRTAACRALVPAFRRSQLAEGDPGGDGAAGSRPRPAAADQPDRPDPHPRPPEVPYDV